MSIEISCPHCDTMLEVDPRYAGKRMSCASCGGEFVVPSPDQRGGPAPPPTPGRSSSRGAGRSQPRRKHGAVARNAARGGRRAAAARSRSDDDILFQDESPRYRSRQGGGYGLQIGLACAAVAAIIVIAILFTRRGDQDLYSPAPDQGEEVKTDWTDEELLAIVANRPSIESSYRATFYNEYVLPASDPRRSTYRDKREEYRQYLIREIQIGAPGAEPRQGRRVVDNLLDRWEKDEYRKLKESPPEKLEPDRERASAIEREDRAIDRRARAEIQEFMAEQDVPGDYTARAQWLRDEFIQLREEAVEEGYNLNRFAFQVARIEELWVYYRKWLQDHERNRKSYLWTQENVKQLVRLRDRWRRWSAGKDNTLTKDEVETSLRGICNRLKRAETIYVYD
jgi:hypothetical protein